MIKMVRVIAECGCNWEGSLLTAMRMIQKAKDVGCWAAKFQLFNLEQAKQVNLPTNLILREFGAKTLLKFGRDIGIEVFFTPMYLEAVDILERIGIRFYKIRHADSANGDILNKFENILSPKFVSLSFRRWLPLHNLYYLKCVPKYPAKQEDYYEVFGCIDTNFDGVSDHTGNVELLYLFKDIFDFWEIHVKLDGTTPIEDKWSVSFSELERVLK